MDTIARDNPTYADADRGRWLDWTLAAAFALLVIAFFAVPFGFLNPY